MGTNLLQTQADGFGTLNRIYLLALAYSLFYNVTKITKALKKKKREKVFTLNLRLIYGNTQVLEHNPLPALYSCFFKPLFFVTHFWHLTDSKTDFVTLLHSFTHPP